MNKKLKRFTAGYFTDPTARALLSMLDGGHPRPAAIHIEPQSRTWLSSADFIQKPEDFDLSYHGEACMRLLAGAPQFSDQWDTGFIDEEVSKVRYAFLAAAMHPDVRVITISSTQTFLNSFSYKNYYDLAQPVVLKAAGNKSDDWQSFRSLETLSGEIYMPGLLRVGESLPNGEIYPNSQASGPAFVCDHPRDMKEIMGDGHYFATRGEVQEFLEWRYHSSLTKSRYATLMAYQGGAENLEMFPGTSAATPHAGSLVMRHTVNMKGITSYDIVPALIMAAQINEAPPEALRRIENQSGMIFDPFHYGHGILVSECLGDTLRDIWMLRNMSGPARKAGEFSNPVTVTGRGHMSARTEKAEGPVVNVVLALALENDEPDGYKTEARIPEFVMLRSPQGTRIHLPILYDRKVQYGEYVRAGYQTSAFFGEDISRGNWEVEYSQSDENPLRIASMQIIAHTMHPKSPAHVYFKAFQKAIQRERSTTQAEQLPKPSV